MANASIYNAFSRFWEHIVTKLNKKEDKHIKLTQAEYDALSDEDKNNGKMYLITDANEVGDAGQISYNNTSSGLSATDVQSAVDEIVSNMDTSKDVEAGQVSYNNTSSGLASTNIQNAVDEIVSNTETRLNSNRSYTETVENNLTSEIATINSSLNGKQNNLGFTPVQQGGGTGQGTNKIYIGWNSSLYAPKIQVDDTDLGALLTSSNFTSHISGTGQWERFTPTQVVWQVNGVPFTWFADWSMCRCYVNKKLKLAWVQLCLQLYNLPSVTGSSFGFGDYKTLGTGFPAPAGGDAWVEITNNSDYYITVAAIKSDGGLYFQWGRANVSNMSKSNWFIGTCMYPIA